MENESSDVEKRNTCHRGTGPRDTSVNQTYEMSVCNSRGVPLILISISIVTGKKKDLWSVHVLVKSHC